MARNAYLILENGKVFSAKSFGATGEIIGELVFSTGMTGYVEALTDPSYFGQIVVQTFPLIGNYGIMNEDCESNSSYLSAYVVRDWCQEPSNFRCEGNLDTFLKAKNVIGLYGIDTRSLAKIIRDEGIMNAKIAFSDEACDAVLDEIRRYKIVNAVKNVSVKECDDYVVENARKRVALLDMGTCFNVPKALNARGCDITVYPYNSTADEILDACPDGIVISEGPGDPSENTAVLDEIKRLIRTGIPMIGLGLGHQLIALACGAKLKKLKYGHHGANQPVSDTATHRVLVTSQNHNYSVDTIPTNAKESYVNVNDGDCEGITYLDKPIFTIQFHPDSITSSGNTGFIYDSFLASMNK